MASGHLLSLQLEVSKGELQGVVIAPHSPEHLPGDTSAVAGPPASRTASKVFAELSHLPPLLLPKLQ